jgi:hypothetical protein
MDNPENYQIAPGSVQMEHPEPQPQQFTPPPMPAPNPLLAKLRIPPEIHKIPSGGLFYDETILKSDKGELHVYPMTALDELEVKSPDLLFNGEAITNVLERCIPEIKNPTELFVKDVDFLMLVLRKATFGAEYEVHYDHECSDDSKSHSYIVNLNTIIQEAKTINPVEFKQQSELTIGVGESQYNVKLSPMRLKHLIKMMQSVDTTNTQEERKLKLFGAMAMLIDNVDGITDKTQIFEFLSTVPTTWTEQIALRAEELGKWGPTFSAKAICKDCGSEVDLHININPLSFFTSQ